MISKCETCVNRMSIEFERESKHRKNQFCVFDNTIYIGDIKNCSHYKEKIDKTKTKKKSDRGYIKDCYTCSDCGIKPVWTADWESVFLHCPKCGKKSPDNHSYQTRGKGVRLWNKINKERKLSVSEPIHVISEDEYQRIVKKSYEEEE